ncbi:MAG: hypothetical protein HC897_09220, partial [Thermoanaerobaculia bacterium]|nr:hypothetical protein [Thermoanaerobaculia bacterium]
GLRYSAGGAGFSGQPGSNLEGGGGDLGRGWAHAAFQRIVLSPDASNVFLVTEAGTFRQFSDLNLDGVYVTEAPSDEYRKLTKTPTGWSLRDLDGTVTTFGAAGEWLSTADRNSNTVAGVFSGGVLVGLSTTPMVAASNSPAIPMASSRAGARSASMVRPRARTPTSGTAKISRRLLAPMARATGSTTTRDARATPRG